MESCTDIPDCMTAEEIRIATLDDEHICILSEIILHGWPSTKAEVPKSLQQYWLNRDEIAIKDSIAMKGRRRIKPVVLQDKAIKQLHLNNIANREDRAAGMSPYIG